MNCNTCFACRMLDTMRETSKPRDGLLQKIECYTKCLNIGAGISHNIEGSTELSLKPVLIIVKLGLAKGKTTEYLSAPALSTRTPL